MVGKRFAKLNSMELNFKYELNSGFNVILRMLKCVQVEFRWGFTWIFKAQIGMRKFKSKNTKQNRGDFEASRFQDANFSSRQSFKLLNSNFRALESPSSNFQTFPIRSRALQLKFKPAT